MKNKLVLAILVVNLLLAACAGKTDSPTLAGTAWKLVKIGGQPVAAGTSPTLVFDDQGQASGNASCNSFGGAYQVKAGKLSFDSLMSTMMACAAPGVMEQEAAYLAALFETASYQIDGERLTLFAADGAALVELAQ